MFTRPTYSVREDVGNAPVAVMLAGGTLDRSVILTVTPSSSEATGEITYGLCKCSVNYDEFTTMKQSTHFIYLSYQVVCNA